MEESSSWNVRFVGFSFEESWGNDWLLLILKETFFKNGKFRRPKMATAKRI